MAELNVLNQCRKGTTAEWESSSYVLKAGEIGFDTELEIFKIGNGVNFWKDLKSWLSSNDKPQIIVGDGLYATT